MITKLSKILTAAALATVSLLPVSSSKIQAYDAVYGDVSVSADADSLTIGNEAIERTFSMEGGTLRTAEIVNKRTDGRNTVFTPAEGSEEFIISLTKEQREPESAIDRSGWSATADSYQNASGPSDGPASNLIDGDVDSIWHTNYGGGEGPQDYPYNVRFDLGEETTFKAFSYTPRQQGEDTNGNLLGYALYAANAQETLDIDSDQWVKIAEGEFQYDGVNPIYVNLDEEYTANQLKLVALSSKNGENFGGGAEFNLHEQEIVIPQDDDRKFASSALTLDGEPEISDTTATINDVEKTGKKVTFHFAPYTFDGVEYTITENIVMYNGDHFMRKYLEISIPDEAKATAAIDYIDLEHFQVNESDAQWTVPTDAGGVVSLNQYKANLGQPIYIQGMFFGSEFPVTDTQIVDGTGFMRYYTGKTFERLGLDNQLTADGKYVTWQTVAGAARSTENEVIQADFFDYIESISTPTEFRIQYNSWFDNMMLIDDESIQSSFIEIDKELSAAEVRPLDSYFVDDGWNNYNNDYVLDASRSGTTLNQSGFWEFNSKFPEGLTPSSELVDKFGSYFGVWVGPRGGYNYYGTLADILTESGKGSKAGGSIDVADRTYVKNFQEMAIRWQQDYGVNYWKWDGFADDYQYSTWAAADGVPGYANNHMTGGYQNMYHVTDLWEAWIDLFEAVRQSEIEDGVHDLWISLTCYVNPSPWWLQWANSVWLQCTMDQGDAGSSSSKMDRQLTYRDACYYDFIKNHEFQFPLEHLYNHDPVYGREGTGMNINTATDEQFQNYLYMMATRGSAFWELYYSDSIMTEGKYEVNAEFLQWAEENHHILQNAKMFGGSPNTGTSLGGNGGGENNTYGFSAFDGTDGILSVRNPSTETKEITFTFDRTIGVPEDAGTLQYHLEHTHNLSEGTPTSGTLTYGETYTFSLQPDEVRILEISADGDTSAPQIERIMSDGDQEIIVRFNEKVSGSSFQVEGAEIESVEKSADDVTYHITLSEAPKNGTTLTVTAEDIADLAGNKVENASASLVYHRDGLVLNAQAEALEGSKVLSDVDALNSPNGFTVYAKVQSTSNGTIAAQENGYTLGIDEEGRAYFTLNGATAVSEMIVNDGEEHSIVGVRENNGMLKLYVDGTLDGSAYRAENQYYMVNAGETTLGNDAFSGNVTLRVYDLAMGYDEVAELVNPSDERKPLDPENMSVTVSGTSEGDKSTVFDGDDTTFWTSERADEGIQKGNPYLIVDLDEEFIIDRVDYTKRYYNGPQNQWKCTGNLREYVLEVSMDGETWTEVSAGETFQDESYTTKGDGGTTQIEFTPIKARYIRISGTASYHWQAENIDKFMTVADLKIFGEKEQAQNVALQKEVSAKWAADGSDAQCNPNDRPITMAVDGVNDNTVGNYGEFGADGRTDSSYMEVDLGARYDIESLNLYRYWADGRTYQNTVIALSETADFADPYIVYNSDAANVHGFGAGSDEAYAETSEGHTFVLDELVSARYVRVYMNGTTSGGTTNHIVELEVMGYEQDAETDKTALSEAIEAAKAIEDEGYTADSWTAMQDALAAAETIMADEGATQEQVDQAASVLQSAMDALQVKASASALNALRNMVGKAEALESDDEALKGAIETARALLSDPDNASVTAVVGALLDLSEAMQDLGGSSDVDALRADVQATIDFINDNILTNVEGIRPGKVEALKAAVAAAQDVVNDPDATADALKAANKAMTKAAQELWEIVSKAELNALIEAANGYLDGDYTAESLDALQAAIESAQAVADNDDATTAEVTQAITNLSDAIAGLEAITLDTSALEHETELVNEMLANLDDYVPSSVEGLADKLADAQNVLENATTQAEIDEAVKSLREARLNARTKADVSALEELIAYAKSLDLSGYTTESAQALIQDIARAEQMANDPEITQEEVNDMVETLQASVDELAEVNDSTNAEDTTNTAATNTTNAMFALMLAAGAAAVAAYRRKRS